REEWLGAVERKVTQSVEIDWPRCSVQPPRLACDNAAGRIDRPLSRGVPALSEWAVAVLSLLLAAGIWRGRRS
ncbi:MAG TPA: IPTL-CTERM sorting domain-containing protein, partial [Casimicrobiaceae bacterium]|nr:IPTL-CTERM sorting domain-containing protein [Casimicrobiaceae bacterium]